jgi:branched-subunit amino acid ABC-type transport system permease component
MVLGLIESAGLLVMGVSYRQAIALIVFIIVLMIKPQGLFAKKEYGS